MLPGQRTQAQKAVSISFPSHSFPLFLVSGSVQFRCRVCVAFAPQVSEQSIQADHADQAPSTVESNIRNNVENNLKSS